MAAALLSLSLPTISSSYNASKEGYGDGHNFVLERAVDYIKKKKSSLAKDWPLDQFLPDLLYGSWYADHSGPRCEWAYPNWKDEFPWFHIEKRGYGCDMIHHYGRVGDLHTELGLKVANTGEYATPYYAKVLFDQAIKFWPGGIVPELSSLPWKNAGYTEDVVGSLNKRYLGRCACPRI